MRSMVSRTITIGTYTGPDIFFSRSTSAFKTRNKMNLKLWDIISKTTSYKFRFQNDGLTSFSHWIYSFGDELCDWFLMVILVQIHWVLYIFIAIDTFTNHASFHTKVNSLYPQVLSHRITPLSQDRIISAMRLTIGQTSWTEQFPMTTIWLAWGFPTKQVQSKRTLYQWFIHNGF